MWKSKTITHTKNKQTHTHITSKGKTNVTHRQTTLGETEISLHRNSGCWSFDFSSLPFLCLSFSYLLPSLPFPFHFIRFPCLFFRYFADYSTTNFARSGFLSTRTFRLAAGALPQDKCPHPIEPMLRKLGLPTRLNKGKSHEE